MRFSNYSPMSDGPITVLLPAQTPQNQPLPTCVIFTWGETQVSVNFDLMQILRRHVERASGDSRHEHKIFFIKLVREVYRTGLKETKDIVEWWQDNVDQDAWRDRNGLKFQPQDGY